MVTPKRLATRNRCRIAITSLLAIMLVPLGVLAEDIVLREVPLGVVPAGAGDWAVSADLARLAWVEPTGNGTHRVVAQGRRGEAFMEVRGIRWAGQQIAYIARSAAGWHVVVGDHLSRPFAEMKSEIAFTPDGSRYGFVGTRDDATWIILDGKEYGPYDGAAAAPPCISADGKRVFFAGFSENRGIVMSDGRGEKEAGPYVWVTHAQAVFSNDGGHLAYRMRNTRAGTDHLVIDEIPGRGYHANAFGPIAISHDGARSAFACQARTPGDQPGEWVIVLDGIEGEAPGGQPLSLVFSPDGKRLAARIRSRNDSAQWVILDGIPGQRYMDIRPDEPLFSPDGRTCIYIGWNRIGPWKAIAPPPPRGAHDPDGESIIVVNGVEAARWVAVGQPAFKPDGRLVYSAVDANQRSHLVLDGTSYPAPFLSKLIVSDPSMVHGLSGRAAGQGGWAVFRIEVTISD